MRTLLRRREHLSAEGDGSSIGLVIDEGMPIANQGGAARRDISDCDRPRGESDSGPREAAPYLPSEIAG